MFNLLKENLLKNKILAIIIIILSIVIITLQTKITLKNNKIENLTMQIESLNTEKKDNELKENTEEFSKNNSVYKEDENSNYFKDIKENFIKIGEINGKLYDENLSGTVIDKFSWIDDFTITDKQIENLLKKLNSDKFKIKCYKNTNSNFTSYRIELIS